MFICLYGYKGNIFLCVCSYRIQCSICLFVCLHENEGRKIVCSFVCFCARNWTVGSEFTWQSQYKEKINKVNTRSCCAFRHKQRGMMGAQSPLSPWMPYFRDERGFEGALKGATMLSGDASLSARCEEIIKYIFWYQFFFLMEIPSSILLRNFISLSN